MKMQSFILCALLPLAAAAQGLDPSALLKPPVDSWPTYNGDYSGRRFSPLKQIHTGNVHTLSLAWASRFSGGSGPNPSIKATPLMVNGILYFTAPSSPGAPRRLRSGEQVAIISASVST